MPAQKRSMNESFDDGEASQLYHPRHAKQSRQLKAEEIQEEEDEQEEQMEEQGGDGDEAVEQQEQDREKADGYVLVFCSFLRLIHDYVFVQC